MTRFTCSTYRCEATYETKCKHGCCEVWECRSGGWWVHKSEAFCRGCSAAWPSAASQVRNWRAAAVKEGNERVCSDCIQRNCGDLVMAVVPLVNGNGHGNDNCKFNGNDNCNGGNGGLVDRQSYRIRKLYIHTHTYTWSHVHTHNIMYNG